MTLVVARRTGDEITIVSDTRITEGNLAKTDHLRNAVIKSVMLSLNLTVSFAGQVFQASQVISRIANEWLNLSHDEIVSHVLQAHIEANCASEFILAFHYPTKLVCVKDGIAFNCPDSAWIGERVGFEVFQKHFNAANSNQGRAPESPEVTVALIIDDWKANHLVKSLRLAMEAVISDANVETVGGFPILVLSENCCFRYCEYIHSEATRMDIEGFNSMSEFPLGDSKSGHYTVYFSNAQFVPQNVCFPVLYLPEGQMGIIFQLTSKWLVRGRGVYAWTFDEFLCQIVDIPGMRVFSTLPNADQLSQIVRPVIGSQEIKNEKLVAKSETSTLTKFTKMASRPNVKLLDSQIVICETFNPRRDITLSLNEIESSGRSCRFLHIGTGRTLSSRAVFRKTIFQQDLVRDMKKGHPKPLTIYLQFDLANDDRFEIESSSGPIRLERLAMTGTVLAS